MFINDLPNASEILKLLLFADDTCALDSDCDVSNLIIRVNTELAKISEWFLANKISVYVAKCKYRYIIFHNQNKKIPDNIPAVVFNSNNSLVTPLERIHIKKLIIKVTNILVF